MWYNTSGLTTLYILTRILESLFKLLEWLDEHIDTTSLHFVFKIDKILLLLMKM